MQPEVSSVSDRLDARIPDLAVCDVHGRDLELSPAMLVAFDRSIDAVLATASPADIDRFHRAIHDDQTAADALVHPVLAAVAVGVQAIGRTPCRTLEEAEGPHRDAILFVAACEMLMAPEWRDQGEFILDALIARGLATDADHRKFGPMTYAGRLLDRERQRLLAGQAG
jgi:hypothetical protein